MRFRRTAALALLAASLLFWTVAPVAPQGSGRMTIATDYELFGVQELSGGGHVTWTLSGDVARELRSKIVGLFDGYLQVPRGFAYWTRATSGDGDGVIDPDEARTYTAALENEFEGVFRATLGTQIGYFRLDRADLFDADAVGGIERSTAGLLGTSGSDMGDLQIRFLFNGRTTTSDLRFPLANRAFADAVHTVFSLRQAQDANLTSTQVGYPGSWPLLAEGGWHVVAADDGRPALWAGDDATGVYANGTSALMRTCTDPVLGSACTDPAYTATDLRYATTARVSFSYTGQVSDANDLLRFEVATAPTFADWTPLPVGNATFLEPTSPGTWADVEVDLAAHLGQAVRFRFNFTSDGAGSARGYFLRDFAIDAPSVFAGTIAESDAHYLIGALSFSELSFPSGGLHVIRTPGGEILLYSTAWDAAAGPPPDQARFQTFNAMENPQILFVAMFAAAYFISRSQEVAYDEYRGAHPSVYRSAASKARWLHSLGKASMVVLVLLYFFPSAFVLVGARGIVGGPAYVFLALILALGVGLGTRAYYRQRLEEAPPPAAPQEAAVGTVPGIPAGPTAPEPAVVAHCTHCLRTISESERTYACGCGAVYHLGCASGLMRCADCRKPISLEVVRKRRTVSYRCGACGEVQAVEEGVDPRTLPCPACGGRLRHLDEGKGYLLVASNPAIAFGWLRDLSKGGKPAVCLSPAAPERLRLEFGLKDADILHVTSSGGAKAIDPKRLDPAGLKAILPLLREKKGGVLLYDGLEQIIAEASLGDVTRFIQKANDMAFVQGVTVIARVAPGVLAESEMQRLASEFDETLDLSAKL